MGGAKSQLHIAQGFGNINYPGQMNTNVYFAGNNATADSEEGALDAAMAVAEYAFGVKYPFSGLESIFMYDVYKNTMFPPQNASLAITTKLGMITDIKNALKKKLAPKAKKPVKKSAAKKAPAKKKAVTSKATKTKKITAKKTVVKKKTSSTKTVARKKTTSKKATIKKSTPKKATKNTAAKKTKTTVKKSTAKVKAKTTKRKSPSKKSTKR